LYYEIGHYLAIPNVSYTTPLGKVKKAEEQVLRWADLGEYVLGFDACFLE
jgi:hypothetical protein